MDIRNELERWARAKLENVDAGHDWWHVKRVLANAARIYKEEGGDWQIIETAVLLHDLADSKFFDEAFMMNEIKDKLHSLGMGVDAVCHVSAIIRQLSFSKHWDKKTLDSLEFRVVQDADRLDAIGAVGIARAFSYGGYKKRVFYDPDRAPRQFANAGEYRSCEGTTINHFYEKLLLLKDLMNTKTGKSMALQRHEYMQSFLKQFLMEMEHL